MLFSFLGKAEGGKNFAIVDSLAVESCQLRSFWGLWLKKLSDIHQKLNRFPSTGQLHS